MTDLQKQFQNIKNQENSYKKEFKTFDEQLQIFKDRKLIIQNDSFVLSKLQRINYYRLSAYFLPFQYPKKSDNKDIFLENTTFEDIIQLYYFDSELRKIVFEAIEYIEVYFRTQITYCHALKYGAFGTISKIYSILKTEEQKEVITKLKGINNNVFRNWLHGLSVVRNICAHHSRLWNKTLGVKFEVPRKLNQFSDIKHNDKIFFALSIIEYILNSIGEDELDFKFKIKDLLHRYSKTNIESMGFPLDWKNNLLWG